MCRDFCWRVWRLSYEQLLGDAMSKGELRADTDVRALARVGRSMLTDRRQQAGRKATVVPAALAALLDGWRRLPAGWAAVTAEGTR